jgi:hypothetical protein
MILGPIASMFPADETNSDGYQGGDRPAGRPSAQATVP